MGAIAARYRGGARPDRGFGAGAVVGGYRRQILACSFCLDVAPATWWGPRAQVAVLALAAVGLVVGFAATSAPRGRRRTGGLLVALGLVVLLPLAAVAVRNGRTSVTVVTDPPPLDAAAWRVSCEAAFLAPPTERPGGEAAALGRAACEEATAGWRSVATLLAGLAAASVVAGVAVTVSGRRRERAAAVA